MKVNEIITEAANPAQQAAIAISMKKAGKKPRSQVNELAPSPGGPDSGDYFRTLASAWYNGAYDSGSLQKGIKTNQDIERLLQRGIVAPDGVARKYNIDYNSDFDGVIIFSDDYYEHGDHDDTDSRTGKPFGPYDYMEFSDDELSEGIYESAELVEEFDLIESIINRLAAHNGVDAEVIWEDLETLTEDELYAFAVTSEPIMESQGVLKDDNSDVTDISNSDYMRIKGIVDKKYPGYELASLNIGPNGYIEIEIYNYKTHDTKHLKTKSTSENKQGVLKDDNSDVTDISDSDYMRIKGIVDKKYPGYELASLNIGRDGYIEIEIYNYKTHDTKHLKTKSTSENKQGVLEDWQKANKRDRTAGMSQKAVNAYRRENPGSKLKTAVTTKPSKLKRGSKASKRRKSYCSRSRGQMKMHSISCAKTPDKAICKARRRWNC